MSASSFTLTLLAIALFATHGVHAEFIAPEDNPPFRRDQLPLDVDTMASLSRQFSTLASTLPTGDPANERSAAQCIAIAIALDPVNRQATNQRESWGKTSEPIEIKEEQIASTKATTWRSYAWLSEIQSGKDANILADCIGDVLAKLDPQHPKAESLAREKGEWAEWVAPLAEFQKLPSLAANAEPDQQITPKDPEESASPAANPAQQAPKQATFRLKTTSAKSPLWLFNPENESYILNFATVTLSQRTSDEDQSFSFRIPDLEEHLTAKLRFDMLRMESIPAPAAQTAHLTAKLRFDMLRNSKKYLEQTLGKLPEGGLVSFRFDHNLIYSVKRNGHNLSAPAIALTHACLTGKEVSAVVIGVVAEENQLSSPENIWELIRLLETLPSARIVLPKTAEELLPSLIAMEKHPLFLKHDIFLAADIKEMITFSWKEPNESTQAVLSQFNEIRTKAPSAIGPFLANPHVLKRLEAICTACPQFASSRYLSLVGKSQRTSLISKKVLAHEINMALRPLDNLAEIDVWDLRDLDHTKILLAHETCRKALDPLYRLIATPDRALYGKAIDVANKARTLARGIKTISQRYEFEFDQSFYDKSARTSAHELRNGLPALHRELCEVLGQKYRPNEE
jgi:hypothetical protein